MRRWVEAIYAQSSRGQDFDRCRGRAAWFVSMPAAAITTGRRRARVHQDYAPRSRGKPHERAEITALGGATLAVVAMRLPGTTRTGFS
jgi:hypothetical protein